MSSSNEHRSSSHRRGSSHQTRPPNFTTEFPHPTNLTPSSVENNTRSGRTTTIKNPATLNPDPRPRNLDQRSQPSQSTTSNTNVQRPLPSNVGNRSQGQPPRYSTLSNLGNSILPNPTRRPTTTSFNAPRGTQPTSSRAPQIPQDFLAPIVTPPHRSSSRPVDAAPIRRDVQRDIQRDIQQDLQRDLQRDIQWEIHRATQSLQKELGISRNTPERDYGLTYEDDQYWDDDEEEPNYEEGDQEYDEDDQCDEEGDQEYDEYYRYYGGDGYYYYE